MLGAEQVLHASSRIMRRRGDGLIGINRNAHRTTGDRRLWPSEEEETTPESELETGLAGRATQPRSRPSL